MKLTNKYNLPDLIFQAVKNDKYSKGGADYSVTDLINSPRSVLLKKRHYHEMESDVSDHIWRLSGKSFHFILESVEVENALKEKRLFAYVSGKKISGQADLYHNKTIMDYKETSVWTKIYESRIKEWEKQLNLYAYLFRVSSFEVKKLQVLAKYRDWKKNGGNDNYPKAACELIDLDLWNYGVLKEYAETCVQRLIDNEELKDDELSECEQNETWEKPTTWAVKKNGNKKATRVYDTEQEAQRHAAKEENLFVEKRPGSRPKCDDYCSVSSWCNQYKEYLNN